MGLHVELGRFKLSIGASPAVTDVEKALPPGAIVNQAGTDLVRAQAAAAARGDRSVLSAAPATGEPPDPGARPPAPIETTPAIDRGPMRWQFNQGYNQIWTPRRGRSTPFETLRQLARVSDIIRICIETRKDQMTSLVGDIVPRDKKQATNSATQRGIETARAFFRKPDKRRDFQTWLRMLLEEVLVTDALSIYRRRTRKGDLFALELIDGATIVPLLDDRGDIPLAPEIAYRQIIYGQPVKGGDCTTEQLAYRPRTVMTDSPYGLSPAEAVLLAVNAAINRTLFNLAYYTEGNIPRALMEAPQGWQPDQIRSLQTYMDEMLSGNLGARSRMRIVANGSLENMKLLAEPDFDTKWDEWLLKITCAAYAVPPQEIGFTGDVNKSTGQMQENIVYRRGVKPLGNFLKGIFDDVLETDLRMPEFEWTWNGGEPEDKKVQADVDAIYLARGVYGIDDVRGRLGLEPTGMGPTIDTTAGPIFIEELLAEPPDDDPTTSETTPGLPGPAAAADDDDASARETVTQEELEDEAKKDLGTWRKLAIKAVKAGESPTRNFQSDFLPAETKLEIRLALRKATTVEDVVKVFEGVTPAQLLDRDARALVAPVAIEKAEYRVLRGRARVMKRQLQSQLAKHYRAQGKALGAFLTEGVE